MQNTDLHPPNWRYLRQPVQVFWYMDRRLIGRADDLAVLMQLLTGAAAGRAQFALVSGEAGIGKTRLLDELVREVTDLGGEVLVGGCVPLGEQHAPYAPITEALRGLARSDSAQDLAASVGLFAADGIPTTPGTQGQLFELFLGMLTRLATRGPVLVALEDLHWADQSTVSLLSFLYRHLRDEPVLVIGSYRDDEMHAGHPIRRFLAEAARMNRVAKVELRRLGLGAVSRHIADLLGEQPSAELVDWVFAQSDGNPFITEILVAAVKGKPVPTSAVPLPPTVTDLVLRGVHELTAEAQELLRAAAVIGPSIKQQLLVEVVQASEQRVETMLREALGGHVLVRKSDDVYAFRHVLIQQALCADLMLSERKRLHATVARALTEHPEWSCGVRANVAAEIAYHCTDAGDLPRAFAATIHAGLAALRTYAYAEAHEALQRAVNLWDSVPDPADLAGMDRAELLAYAAHTAYLMGHDDLAITSIHEAIGLVDPETEPHRCAVLHERLARYHFAALRHSPALEAYQRAQQLLPITTPSRERAMVLAGLARLAMLWSRPQDARRHGMAAIRCGRRTGARREEALGWLAIGIVDIKDGDFDGGVGELRRALEVFAELGDHEHQAIAYVNLGCGLHLAGRLAEAVEVNVDGHAFTRRTGLERQYGALLLCNAAEVELLRGHWDHAAALLDGAAGKLPRGRVAAALSMVTTRLATLRGDLSTARQALSGVTAQARQPYWELSLAVTRAELHCWGGEPELARRAVAEGLAAIDGTGEQAQAGALLALGLRAEADLAAQARLQRSDSELAQIHEGVRSMMLRVEQLGELPAQRDYRLLCRAECGRALGDNDQDAWQQAMQSWEESQRPYEAAYAGFRLAEAVLALPDRQRTTSAAAALTSARLRAAELGANNLFQEIDALARIHRLRLDRPKQQASARLPDRTWPLTPREVEVLRLVASGQSNRDIGRALFITDKTASVHVSNILRKLEVSSRIEAAVAARRLGVAN